MSEKSPGKQQIGLIKREEQLSLTLDPAPLSCREIIVFQRIGVYNRNGRRPELDAPVAFNMDRS